MRRGKEFKEIKMTVASMIVGVYCGSGRDAGPGIAQQKDGNKSRTYTPRT